MKTKAHKPITTAQIKKIYTLLNQRGLLDEKKALVLSYSDNRTFSTKELTCNEARQLINFLLGSDNDEEKRVLVFRSIYRLAWNMNIIYGDTQDDYHMNLAKLNLFCRERGTVKKNLAQQNLLEMRRTERQFRAMSHKFENKAKAQ